MATARVVTWRRAAAIELRSGTTTAIVIPGISMMIASFVVDDFDYVARPGGLAAARAGHTTAVPLLYPWANRLSRRAYRAAGTDVTLRGLALHTDANGLPIHGTMAARPEWDVTALGRGRVRAQFDFGAHPELLRSFPFPHVLDVAVSVTPVRLRVVTTVHASAGTAVPVSFGWHPYWRVPGPRNSWSIALAATGHARLDRRGIPTGRVDPEPATRHELAGQDYDDLYTELARPSVALYGRDRALHLDLDAGYPNVQVYAPAAEAFCCLEPMTAPTNGLVSGQHPVVPAGGSFSAEFRATVR